MIWLRLGTSPSSPASSPDPLIVFFAAFLVRSASCSPRRGASPAWSSRAPATSRRCWWRGRLDGVLVLERPRHVAAVLRDRARAAHAATERVVDGHGLTAFVGGAFIAHQPSGTSRGAEGVARPVRRLSGAGYQIGRRRRPRHRRGRRHRPRGADGPCRTPERLHAVPLGEELGLIGLPRSSSSTWCSSPAGCAAHRRARQLRSCHRPVVRDRAAAVHRDGASKLIPLTGLTLRSCPTAARAGGNYALVAPLLRISNAARAPLPRRAPAVPLAGRAPSWREGRRKTPVWRIAMP